MMSEPEPNFSHSPGTHRDTDLTQDYPVDDSLVQILDSYFEALKTGAAPTESQLLAQYPKLATQLKSCLDSIRWLHAARQTKLDFETLGDFRLLRQIGQGGMGTVYEATQLSLNRRVAIKVLDKSPVTQTDAAERFAREAATVASLHHTNIVPIFYVGDHEGTRYYAMQYIDGDDLSKSISSSEKLPSPTTVAKWAVQATEALQHAHQRRVIHRDVKPSNLILDKEGRLWLTDFGLARKTDDVTLSITGALLGTPRYMSPEQTSPGSQPIDQRSDIFSLGATLYQLLCGHAPFDGDSTFEVISNIQYSEPTPLRIHRPEIPRDLETIILKCLEKLPEKRYQTAAELLWDLQAFQNGRAIRARRATFVQTTVRWTKQNRQRIVSSSVAATLTAAATLAVALTFQAFHSWNLSGVRLDAINAPLVATFVDSAGNIQSRQTLPMQSIVELKGDDYKVEVAGVGALSNTFDLELIPGFSENLQTVSLSDQWLKQPVAIQSEAQIVDLDSTHAIVSWYQSQLPRNSGLSLQLLNGPITSWTLPIDAIKQSSSIKNYPGFASPPTFFDKLQKNDSSGESENPWVLPAPIDINQDGTGDFIIVARHQAWLMAVSGQGDQVLWFQALAPELSENASPRHVQNFRQAASTVLYQPITVPDLDSDGAEDLVVTTTSIASSAPILNNQFESIRQIQAISGRTGKLIWSQQFDSGLFDIQSQQSAPRSMKWFPHQSSGRVRHNAETVILNNKLFRSFGNLQLNDPFVYLPGKPELLTIDGESAVAVLTGRSISVLSCETGEHLAEPKFIGVRPGADLIWKDLDHDNMPECIWIAENPHPFTSNQIDAMLGVWSMKAGENLWLKNLDAYFPNRFDGERRTPIWPLLADLNADGKFEVLVPDGRSYDAASLHSPDFAPHVSHGKIACFDAVTGDENWRLSIPCMDGYVQHFVDGLDVNGDGTRDVFVASLSGDEIEVYVDAISGADGTRIWTTQALINADADVKDQAQLGNLLIWNSLEDGWPQIVVPVTIDEYGTTSSQLFTFSAGTGTLLHSAQTLESPKAIDLDGDGLQELVLIDSDRQDRSSSERKLKIVRGIASEPWRRLGDLGMPIADLNADHTLDLVRSWGDGTLTATSGANGQLLWRTRPISATSKLLIFNGITNTVAPPKANFPLQPVTLGHDIDADGKNDLIVCQSHTSGLAAASLHAISGKDGGLIWTAEERIIQEVSGTINLSILDLDRDGKDEIIWYAAYTPLKPDIANGTSQSRPELWLNVFSAATGKFLWERRCSPPSGSLQGLPLVSYESIQLDLCFGDFNGDGVVDILVPAIRDDGSLENVAVSGFTGEVFWTYPLGNDGLGAESLQNWITPTFADINNNGRMHLICVEPENISTPAASSSGSAANIRTVIRARRANDGVEIWDYQTDSIFTHFRSYDPLAGGILRPVVLGRSNASNLIAVGIPGGDSKIVVLLADGKLVEQKTLPNQQSVRFCAVDINNDESDELLYMQAGTLSCTAVGESIAPLWQVTIGQLPEQRLLELQSDASGRMCNALVVTDWIESRVMGLDLETGTIRWSCPGPIAMSDEKGAYFVPATVTNLKSVNDHDPLFFFKYNSINIVRSSVLTQSNAKPKINAEVFVKQHPQSFNRFAVDIDRDPRWSRDLLWLNGHREFDASTAKYLAYSCYFATFLILLPMSAVYWIFRYRTFSLMSLLSLPAIAIIFLQALMISPSPNIGFTHWLERVGSGLAAVPPLLFALAVACAFFRQRWNTLFRITATILVLTFVFAGIGIAMDSKFRPFSEYEHYDWTGWYFIFLPVVYVTSCGYIAYIMFQRLRSNGIKNVVRL